MTDQIFFIQLGIPAEHEAAFNDVYDNDHLRHILEIPGVRDCIRYKLQWSDNPDMLEYLAIYHIDDPGLPRSDAWKRQGGKGRWPTDIRPHVTGRRNGVFRRIFQTGAVPPGPNDDSTNSENIYFLLQSIPTALDEPFNRLYNTDHIPLMLQTPGVPSCTRYKLEYSDTGEVPDYLAVYAIDKAERPRTPEWKAQTSKGAWPTEMRPHFTARRNGGFTRISRIVPK